MAAVPVFVGDVAKGVAAAGFGALLADDGVWGLAYVAGGAAMVGHAFPVFARFVGGRSILTFVGTVIVATPIATAISIGILLVVFAVTRSFAWGARVGMVALPFVQLVVDGPYQTAATGVLMTFIGVRFGQAALADRRRAGKNDGVERCSAVGSAAPGLAAPTGDAAGDRDDRPDVGERAEPVGAVGTLVCRPGPDERAETIGEQHDVEQVAAPEEDAGEREGLGDEHDAEVEHLAMRRFDAGERERSAPPRPCIAERLEHADREQISGIEETDRPTVGGQPAGERDVLHDLAGHERHPAGGEEPFTAQRHALTVRHRPVGPRR